MILVDTTVWIDHFRDRRTTEQRALQHLITSGKAMIAVTDIIVTEILQGIQNDDQFTKTRHILRHLPCLTARAPTTFIHAAQLYRQCRKKGATIRSTVDCLIAAVCLENRLSLLHHDADFHALARHCHLEIADPGRILA